MYTTYTGERVRLRPFATLQEAEAVIFPLGLIDFGHWLPEYWTPQSLRKFYERDGMLGHSGANFMALERQDSGEACGYMYVQLPATGQISVEIGTMLLPQHHGLGLGIEAKRLAISLLFENYPLETVFAKTLGSNARALSSMQRCGMEHRGCWRGFVCRGGRRVDAHVYDIHREQWLTQPWRGSVQRGASYD